MFLTLIGIKQIIVISSTFHADCHVAIAIVSYVQSVVLQITFTSMAFFLSWTIIIDLIKMFERRAYFYE